jgi:hypothetical protein
LAKKKSSACITLCGDPSTSNIDLTSPLRHDTDLQYPWRRPQPSAAFTQPLLAALKRNYLRAEQNFRRAENATSNPKDAPKLKFCTMSLFWVGDKPDADALAALVPNSVQRKLDTRRRSRSPRKAPPKKPSGPPGGTSQLETLPTELRTQLFAYEGFNLIRELTSLLSASKTMQDTVGTGPRTMIRSVLPALRAWRNRVFPHRAPTRPRVASQF